MPELLTTHQQNTRAAYAHLTALINLVSGIGGLLAALFMLIYYRKRAVYVAFHALQSLLMQAIVWIGGGIISLLCWLGSSWLQEHSAFGFFTLPFAFLISLIPLSNFVFAVLASMDVWRGNDYHYPVVAGWALKILNHI